MTVRQRPLPLTRRSALRSQVIDEQVERGDSLCGAADRGVPDTHAEVEAIHTSLMAFTGLFTFHRAAILPTDVLARSVSAAVGGTLRGDRRGLGRFPSSGECILLCCLRDV